MSDGLATLKTASPACTLIRQKKNLRIFTQNASTDQRLSDVQNDPGLVALFSPALYRYHQHMPFS